MKYRSKPIEIEAFQFRIDNCPDWFMDKISSLKVITYESFCYIATLEGRMRADKGDWIIKGTEGEIYPCKDVVFKKKYEPVFSQDEQ